MKKLLIFIAGGFLLFSGQSCTKKFESLNKNPNAPEDVDPTNILAYTIEDYAAKFFDVWGDMNEPETYGGHLGKIQYIDEARYVFRTTVVTTNWRYTYRALKNLQIVIDASKTSGATNMEAAALTFQTFIFQIATDTWRDIPFSDAIKGDSGVVSPKYDTQETIYPELLKRLKQAGDLFAQEGGDALGEGDLLYNGKVEKWRKFCNSLRLRVAIRISGADPALAKSNIEEIMNNASTYPIFENNDDNAFLWWPGSTPYIEPWASDAQGRDDHAVSAPLVNTLKDLNDPRLSIYAKPAPSDGSYRGVEIGPAGQVSIVLYSRIGARFRNTDAGFTPFMRYAEVQFILAEAAAKGWSVGVSAQSAYEQGISASMEENGVTADISTYLAGTGVKWDGDVKKIYLQKWIAVFKDGHEAWAETRRTDVPLLSAAKGSPYAGHNRPPFRYPYPQNESTLNGPNLAPYIAELKDNFWGKQMWWDKRAGVQ